MRRWVMRIYVPRPQARPVSATARQAGVMVRIAATLSLVAVAAAFAVLGPTAQPAGPAATPAWPPEALPEPRPTYVAPLTQPLHVIRGFSPPAQRYGPGHLGVDLRTRRASGVAAAASGVVRFAGPVAGRGVVVLVHRDGMTTEYEPVAAAIRTGQRVNAGERIGVVEGRHRGCAEPCLHWGARRHDSYVDPMDLLRPLGPVVLLP